MLNGLAPEFVTCCLGREKKFQSPFEGSWIAAGPMPILCGSAVGGAKEEVVALSLPSCSLKFVHEAEKPLVLNLASVEM